jgi:hypothetical protein
MVFPVIQLMPKTSRRLLTLAVAAILLCPGWAWTQTKSITILHTSAVFGYVEPCG